MRGTRSIRQKLEEVGIRVPAPTPPVGAFVPFVRAGDLVFISGHIAKRSGTAWVGRLGESLGLEEGRAAARASAIDALGTLEQAAGGLENVTRIVKLVVFVNSDKAFTAQPAVADGASEVFRLLDPGGHARSAVGVSQLPLGACVEIELVAEVRRGRPRRPGRHSGARVEGSTPPLGEGCWGSGEGSYRSSVPGLSRAPRSHRARSAAAE